jgi:hypothetical protein
VSNGDDRSTPSLRSGLVKASGTDAAPSPALPLVVPRLQRPPHQHPRQQLLHMQLPVASKLCPSTFIALSTP